MRLKFLLAAVLLAAPLPALAQVTARYKVQGGKEIRIEAAANGDYRFDIAGVTVLRIDGVEYVALPAKGGVAPVAKFRDVLALVKAEMQKKPAPGMNLGEDDSTGEGEDPLAADEAGEGEAAVAGEAADAAEVPSEEELAAAAGEAADAVADASGEAPGQDAAPPADLQVRLNYTLVRKGEENVGGRSGTAWDLVADVSIGGKPMEVPKGQEDSMSKMAVMSRDPALTPLAAPFKLGVETLTLVVGSSFGENSNFEAKIKELMAEGVPIRFAQDLVLVSADAGAIDPARFALPGPVMQAADFLEKAGPPGRVSAMPALP